MGENPYADLETRANNMYGQQNDLLNQSEQIQNEQIDANNKYALDNIERQRGYAQKDFEKEARGAYQDYQKQVNPYGVQAENIFSSGLGNSGYSETSKLNAYNTYQNRFATARQSTDRLMEDFNNQMNQAMLEANQEKAQVALQKLQTQMSNLWQQLSFDSSLTQNKVNYNQWLEQFNYQKQQDEIANAFAREQFEYQKQQDSLANSYRNYYSGSGSSGGNTNNELTDTSDTGSNVGTEGGSSSGGSVSANNLPISLSSALALENMNKNKNVIPTGVRVSDMANWAYANKWQL